MRDEAPATVNLHPRLRRLVPIPGPIVIAAATVFSLALILTRSRAAPMGYMILQGQPFSDPSSTAFGVESWRAGLGITHGMVYPFQSYRPGQAMVFNAMRSCGASGYAGYVPLQLLAFLLAGCFFILRLRDRPRLWATLLASLAAILASDVSAAYDKSWMSESLGRTLALCGAFVFGLGAIEGRSSFALLAGALWGAENAVRTYSLAGPPMLLVVALVLAVMGYDRNGLGRSAWWAAIGFGAVMLSWLGHNWVATGYPMLSLWSFFTLVPLTGSHADWTNAWDARLWWDKMHMSEAMMAKALTAQAWHGVDADPHGYARAVIHAGLASASAATGPPLVILAIVAAAVGTALFRCGPDDPGAIRLVGYVVWTAAIMSGRPKPIVAGLGAVAMDAVWRARGPERSLTIWLATVLLVSLLVAALGGGLPRFAEVLAWIPAALVVMALFAPWLPAGSPLRPEAVPWKIARLACVAPLLAAAALVVGCALLTTIAPPRRVPAVETALSDNQPVFEEIAAGHNHLPAPNRPVRLTGYVCTPVCTFGPGDGDPRARAYEAFRDRSRVVFDLITPVRHDGKLLGIQMVVLVPDTRDVAAVRALNAVSIDGTLRYDPAEPYSGRYLLVADRMTPIRNTPASAVQ